MASMNKPSVPSTRSFAEARGPANSINQENGPKMHRPTSRLTRIHGQSQLAWRPQKRSTSSQIEPSQSLMDDASVGNQHRDAANKKEQLIYTGQQDAQAANNFPIVSE